MAITYTWTIVAMDCYPQAEGETDVVFTSHWTLFGTDGTYKSFVYGTANLTYQAGTPFTPYDQLTESQVIGWTQDTLGIELVANYETNVAQQIQNQINPPIITPPLPWA